MLCPDVSVTPNPEILHISEPVAHMTSLSPLLNTPLPAAAAGTSCYPASYSSSFPRLCRPILLIPSSCAKKGRKMLHTLAQLLRMYPQHSRFSLRSAPKLQLKLSRWRGFPVKFPSCMCSEGAISAKRTIAGSTAAHSYLHRLLPKYQREWG